jgi:hypothetical protein
MITTDDPMPRFRAICGFPSSLVRTNSVARIETTSRAHRDGERDPQDHPSEDGPDVGLEEVRAHSGDVSHVVTHRIGDRGRVAGIVFGDPGFHLPDEVRPDVGGFRVDPAAHAGKKRNRARAEAESSKDRENLVLDDCLGHPEGARVDEE